MSIRVLAYTTLIPLCAIAHSPGLDAQVAPAGAPPNISFEKHILSNGLEVILSRDNTLPLVAVNLWYHVGPANEAEGRSGFAHLFEHMMFQGSKHVPEDQHFLLLQSAGATAVNGTTNFDRTSYFETVPSNQLELALWIESDRMGYLLEQLDQTALSNQQDVVRNERREGENIPYSAARETLLQTMLPPGHPYYGSVIGSHADIQAAELEDVRQFFREFYGPNNASLAIVGDIDLNETLALVEQYFGTLRQGPEVPRFDVDTPRITSERRRVVPLRVELARVYMGWLSASIFEPGDAEAAVAAEILAGGRSSRLYRALVYDQQIAQAVSASQQSAALTSRFVLNVTARPGHSADAIEAAIDQVLDEFRRSPPTPDEVARAVTSIETRMIRRLESFGGFGGVADRLSLYNHYLGDPGFMGEDIERFRAVTPESVLALAQAGLRPSERAVILAVPGEPEPLADVPTPQMPVQASVSPGGINKDEPWRSTVPTSGPVPTVTPPTPESATLENGLTVIVSPQRGVPFVSAELVVGTGSGANPLDRPGLASLVGSMLDEGTTTRTALEIADEVAGIGARFGTSISMDGTRLTMSALTPNFGRLLDVVADVVLRPSFPAEELTREKASRLAQLAQQLDEPAARADAAFAGVLYGPRHPYGFIEVGTEQSVEAATRNELVSFWEEYFVPGNAALVVAGDMSISELLPLAERAFGEWAGRVPEEPVLAEAVTADVRLIIVDMPGAPQTQLRVGRVGVPRSSGDYEAIQVMNTGLGGMFSSRINMNLREEHGYTYGARSRFSFRKGPGPFSVRTAVRTDITAPAVSEIFRELRELLSDPLRGEELQRVQDSLTLSLPGTLETSAGVAGRYAETYLFGLGLDYYRDYDARVRSVTEAQVLDVARRHLAPEAMVIVAAGDRSRIEQALRGLNLGEVKIVEREADPGFMDL